jgi:hypothetical protein
MKETTAAFAKATWNERRSTKHSLKNTDVTSAIHDVSEKDETRKFVSHRKQMSLGFIKIRKNKKLLVIDTISDRAE